MFSFSYTVARSIKWFTGKTELNPYIGTLENRYIPIMIIFINTLVNYNILFNLIHAADVSQ